MTNNKNSPTPDPLAFTNSLARGLSNREFYVHSPIVNTRVQTDFTCRFHRLVRSRTEDKTAYISTSTRQQLFMKEIMNFWALRCADVMVVLGKVVKVRKMRGCIKVL